MLLYSTNIGEEDAPTLVIEKDSMKKVKEEVKDEEKTLVAPSEGSEEDPKEAKKIAQKAARAEKARAARLAKKEASKEPAKKVRISIGVGEPENTPPPTPAKKVRKRKAKGEEVPVGEHKKTKTVETQTENEPPAWFKSFMANTRVEEAKIKQPKKAQRAVRKEAAAEAHVKWQEPEVRERVSKEQDHHMASMHKLYSQIFRR